MSRSRKAIEWLVVGPEPHMGHCLRCGGTVPKPIMPCSIEALLDYTSYAKRLHENCVEVKP